MNADHLPGCVYQGQAHRGECLDDSPIPHGACVYVGTLGTPRSHRHEGEPGMWLFPSEVARERD